jgi:hypothetical protein
MLETHPCWRVLRSRSRLLTKPFNAASPSIQAYTFRRKEYHILLLDTPGFDDANKPDIILLEEFVEYLRKISRRGLRLSGIIYFHRINNNRMYGSAQKNLQLLTKICGDQFLRHVHLCTTMWSHIDKEVGDSREEQLKSEFWKDLIDNGAMVERFDGSHESAIAIIDNSLRRASADNTILGIQLESINEQKPLSETEAGRVALEELQSTLQKYHHSLEDVDQQEEELEKNGYWPNSPERIELGNERGEILEKMEVLRGLEQRFLSNRAVDNLVMEEAEKLNNLSLASSESSSGFPYLPNDSPGINGNRDRLAPHLGFPRSKPAPLNQPPRPRPSQYPGRDIPPGQQNEYGPLSRGPNQYGFGQSDGLQFQDRLNETSNPMQNPSIGTEQNPIIPSALSPFPPTMGQNNPPFKPPRYNRPRPFG